MVADEVPVAGGEVAALRPVQGLHLHRVLGVVEVNDVDVEDEHG